MHECIRLICLAWPNDHDYWYSRWYLIPPSTGSHHSSDVEIAVIQVDFTTIHVAHVSASSFGFSDLCAQCRCRYRYNDKQSGRRRKPHDAIDEFKGQEWVHVPSHLVIPAIFYVSRANRLLYAHNGPPYGLLYIESPACRVRRSSTCESYWT